MPALEVGHVFAKLDAKLDDRNFKRYDRAVDKSRAKSKQLIVDQQNQARVLKSTGRTWAEVSREMGVTERAAKKLAAGNDRLGRSFSDNDRKTRTFGRGMDSLAGKMTKLNGALNLLSRGLRLLKWPAITVAIGYAAQAISALTAGTVGLVGALSPLTGLLAILPASFATAGQAAGTFMLGISGIKKALTDMNNEQAKSGQSVEVSANQHQAAARKIEGAERTLQGANRDVTRSTKELTLAREQGIRTLQDMKNASTDATLSEQRSKVSLRQSIIALRKAEFDPKTTNAELADLELSVKEARQGVKEAHLENKRAREDAAKAQHGGVNKLPEVAAANEKLAEAKRTSREDTKKLAMAEKESTQSMEAASSAANTLESDLNKMAPSQRKFAKFLFGLKPQLDQIKETAASHMLPGLEQGLKSVIKDAPLVNKIIGETGDVIGGLGEKAGRQLSSAGWQKDLAKIGASNSKFFERMGTSGLKFGGALKNIMVTARPLVNWFGKLGVEFSGWLNTSTRANRENGKLTHFFDQTKHVANELISIFKHLGAGLFEIGKDGAPLGRELLATFNDSAASFEKWTQSVKGDKSITSWFKDAREPLWAFGRLVHDVTVDFFELGSGEGMSGLTDLLEQLRTKTLPVVTEMLEKTTSSFGPHLIDAITELLSLFTRMGGSSGVLTLYVDGIAEAAKGMNFLLDTVPGLGALLTNLVAIGAVVKGVKWIGAFTGINKGLEWAMNTKMGNKLVERFDRIMDRVFDAGERASGAIYSWASDVGSKMVTGLQKQYTKLKAVGRRAAIAFIGVFAPEVAAGMAAGGKLGDLLAARFPKLAEAFKGGGKMAGRAFIVGVLIGAALLGVWLGQQLSNQLSDDTKIHMKNWGINAAQNFVNGLIWGVNKGIGAINKTLDEANALSFLGVDAPNIGSVGEVDFSGSKVKDSKAQKKDRARKQKKKFREQGFAPGEEPGTGIHPAEAGKDGMPIRPGSKRGLGGAGFSNRRGDLGSWSLGEGKSGKHPEDEAKDTRRKVTDEHHKMRKDIEDNSGKLSRNLLSDFALMRKGGSDQSQKLDKNVTKSAEDMRDKHTGATASMQDNTETRFTAMRDVVSERTDKMSSALTENIGEMNTVTTQGMQQIQNATIKALEAFGIKDADLKLTGSSSKSGAKSDKRGKPGAKKAAGGGIFTIPGEGLQDTVPLLGGSVMAAPGESMFIANRHQEPMLDYAVESTYGVGGLDGFFSTFNRPHFMARGGRAPRSFAGGGPIKKTSNVILPPSSSPIAPLERKLSDLGYVVTSGMDGTHAPTSNHYIGDALDYGDASNNVSSLARVLWPLRGGLAEQFMPLSTPHGGLYHNGAKFTEPALQAEHEDHIHVAVTQALSGKGIGGLANVLGSKTAAIKHLKKLTVTGKDGAFGALAQKALDRVTEGGNEYLDKKANKRVRAGGGVNVPTGPIQTMAREMVSQIWNPGEFSAFNSLEEGEAGWDPRAENAESGAAGLAQALPASKYPPGAWPYKGLKSAKLQLGWMMDYIKERYGSPSSAYSTWLSREPHWYAKGGRVGQPAKRMSKGGSFKGNINHVFKGATLGGSGDWAGLQTLPNYVIASLAESAGRYYHKPVPGTTMMKTQLHEGSNRPGSMSTDAGYGLWAATKPYADPIVAKLGGYAEQLNPVKSAAMMAQMWTPEMATNKTALTNAWHGAEYNVSGLNEHYSGRYDIKNALGGLSYGDALLGRTPKESNVTNEPPKVEKATNASKPNQARKAKRKNRPGIEGQKFTTAPTTKFKGNASISPQALMAAESETGIGIPEGLMKNGKIAWGSVPTKEYEELALGYLKRVAEYKTEIAEQRAQAAEQFPATAMSSSLTPLAAKTIAEALGFHAPISEDVSAYLSGSAAMSSIDSQMGSASGAVLNTYTPGFLSQFERKRTMLQRQQAAALKRINPKAKSRKIAKAARKNLPAKIKAATKKVLAKKSKMPKADKKKLAGAIKGKVTRQAANKTRNTQKKVFKKAANKRKQINDKYEVDVEEVDDPIDPTREGLEAAYAQIQGQQDALAPLINSVAANVQRTAAVGAAQAPILAGRRSFARGGRAPALMGPSRAPGGALGGGGAPSVVVPVAVSLSGGIEALNPAISVEVAGQVQQLGQDAGGRKPTVSAPGRRVSYRSKKVK